MNKRFAAGLSIWLIAVLYYAYEFFLRVSPTVMTSDLAQAFHLQAVGVGMLSAAYFYAYAALQIPGGVLLDHFGIRRLLSLAALCVAVGCFAFSRTDQLWVAIVGRILIGMGSAFAFVGTIKLGRAWFEHRWLAVIIGLTNTTGVLLGMVATAALGFLLKYLSWREALFNAGLVGILFAVLLFLIIRDGPKEELKQQKKIINKTEFWAGLIHVVKQRRSWLVAIIAGLMLVPISIFSELWAPPFLVATHGITTAEAALVSTMVFIGIGVGGPFHGWWSGRLKSRIPVLKLGTLGALISFSLMIYGAHFSWTLILILLFLVGFFTSSMLLCFAINSELNPLSATGVAVGFTNSIVMISSAIFQPLVGFILDKVSHGASSAQFSPGQYRIAFTVAPIADFIAFILIYFLKDIPNE